MKMRVWTLVQFQNGTARSATILESRASRKEKFRDQRLLCSRAHAHSAQDLIHGGDSPLDLLHGVIEVRREAHTGVGTEVHQNVAAQEFRADFPRIWHVNRHGSATAFGIAWGVHAPAALIRQLDESCSHLL